MCEGLWSDMLKSCEVLYIIMSVNAKTCIFFDLDTNNHINIMNFETKGYSAIYHIRISTQCCVEFNLCLQQLDSS